MTPYGSHLQCMVPLFQLLFGEFWYYFSTNLSQKMFGYFTQDNAMAHKTNF
jgi:hypothetical protein